MASSTIRSVGHSELSLDSVSVSFPIYHGGSRSLKKSLLFRSSGGQLASDASQRITVEALRNVSLGFRTGDRVALIGNNGGVPVAGDPSQITDAKNKELIDNFNKVSGEDGLAFYPDWPAPGYYDTLVSGVQGLINGSKAPSAFRDEIAKPYNENLADIGK